MPPRPAPCAPPVMRAGLEDPHAVENVKALQSMVREMTLGEVLLFYGLVAGCFLGRPPCGAVPSDKFVA